MDYAIPKIACSFPEIHSYETNIISAYGPSRLTLVFHDISPAMHKRTKMKNDLAVMREEETWSKEATLKDINLYAPEDSTV